MQCQAQISVDKSKDSKIYSKSTKYFETDLFLTGNGESRIASYYLDWNISIVNNDSIIMLSTLKKNKNDVRSNNRQYFGRLVKSDKYSYKIEVSDFFAVDGCNKPHSRFLDTDTIPFYVDSSLINTVGFWKLKIDNEKDTLIINQNNFLYKTRLKDSQSDIVMSLIPNEKSGLLPVTVKSGLRCGVYLTDRMINTKYYLNITDEKYELIIDRTIPNGMVGKNCDYCVKNVALNLVEK